MLNAHPLFFVFAGLTAWTLLYRRAAVIMEAGAKAALRRGNGSLRTHLCAENENTMRMQATLSGPRATTQLSLRKLRMGQPLTSTLCLLATALVASGCSLGHVNARMAYWMSETKSHLPTGTALADAQSFFEARGLKLVCCVSGPAGAPRYYFALERRVGRFAFTEYNIAVLVALSPAQQVQSVRVERWRIGL